MRNVGAIRKELGIRTVFNILGPLTNPARPKFQVLGVYDPSLLNPLAQVLGTLGVRKGMVVYGDDRLDELSLSDSTSVCEFGPKGIENYSITPEDYSFKRCKKADIAGGTAEDNAKITVSILSGEKGPRRDVVLLNAGAGLYCAGKVKDIRDGIDLAASVIDDGRAMAVLERYKAASRT